MTLKQQQQHCISPLLCSPHDLNPHFCATKFELLNQITYRAMAPAKYIKLDPSHRIPLLKDQRTADLASLPQSLPVKQSHTHPRNPGEPNGSIFFVGTATTILEWEGIRIMTDPNFLHAGDHVHLGPGVTATRQTNPAIDLHALPPLDAILLSHYHADHFDQLVEDSLNRAFPIVTTPHAKGALTKKEQAFEAVTALDFWDAAFMRSDTAAIKVTGMPGKHVPPGPLSVANDILQAVPPTNGWLVELGYGLDDSFETGYRIYISGDTLFVDELKEIPARLQNDQIDLMLVHLGGTTIPGPELPLLMVTMDAKQGLQLLRLVNPDVTIPIHYDDYNVFLSPLEDFKKEIETAGLQQKVVYLDRGEEYRFVVREGNTT
jgi:L-ascorbate metabolism protein UlaG (beta-lactamase superfamily)